MTNKQNILIAGIVAVALSAGAVAMAQPISGESETKVTSAQEERAAQAALDVVEQGRVVDIEHDNEGLAAWRVRVLKPGPQLDVFTNRPADGRHVVVYLDRNFEWLQARAERPAPKL